MHSPISAPLSRGERPVREIDHDLYSAVERRAGVRSAEMVSKKWTVNTDLGTYGRSNGLAHKVRQTTTCTRRRSAAVLALMLLLIL